MNKKNNGGPAFPVHRDLEEYDPGMSLRDYYAGQALQGLLASDACAPEKEFARRSFAMADLMLEARGE